MSLLPPSKFKPEVLSGLTPGEQIALGFILSQRPPIDPATCSQSLQRLAAALFRRFGVQNAMELAEVTLTHPPSKTLGLLDDGPYQAPVLPVVKVSGIERGNRRAGE
jgi:hypothetical protein